MEACLVAAATIRVLVVEDFEPFRRLLGSMLQEIQSIQTVFYVEDGLEAIEKANAMQPDLILLDIGLPKLSGIEAARRIRLLSPESKILFVSQELSLDVVQEAFKLGASGYVAKADAKSELKVAIKAVLAGRTFVGKRFRPENSLRLPDGSGSNNSTHSTPEHSPETIEPGIDSQS